MGWARDTKALTLGKDARAAWDDGSPVFTPVLNMPGTRHSMSGRIPDWEQMVAAILEVGWVLHTWAVCSDDKGRPQAQPLFTRPAQ